ncbi:cell division cycle 7-related protein kinase-like [Aricia agestis]|uniref:cell division cycle 7-related protein kinase-like n=1 Tax=Aricia agestis TaxID=91739 RepID=UPI001C20A9DD|nr:cell division cycle 7-related protein kinase-like [Aricia agestis]
MSRILSIWERMPKDTNHKVSVKNGQHKKEGLTKEDQEKQQIRELQRKLPSLNRLFNLHCKIGEGTFSSVFLGTLKNQNKLPDSEKRYYAIKHLVPTSHPARIEHELRCLQDMGGRENVIGVELCLRHLDTVVFVMPYIPHNKFSDYVGDMDAEEVKQYMKALLTALRHVHSFGVIHRDVKPSNFLYDRENRRYLLVDFGLSQRAVWGGEAGVGGSPPPAHAASAPKRRRDDDDDGPDAKRQALDLSTKTPSLNHSDSDKRRENNTNSVDTVKQETRNAITGRAALVRALAGVPAPGAVVRESARGAGPCAGRGGARGVGSYAGRGGAPGAGSCACAGLGGVCSACAARPAARAARAGTAGFRPPEVLLKVRVQSGAVDVWAAGVVLLSALTARYPLLRATCDAAALAEIHDLLGTAPLAAAAAHLGRRLVTSSRRPGLCLRKLAAWLRAAPPPAPAAPACDDCGVPRPHCVCRDGRPAEEYSSAVRAGGFPDAAFALAARLLDPDPRTRPSAAAALRHPFLAD